MECAPGHLQSNRAPPAVPFGSVPAHETSTFTPVGAESYGAPLLLTKLTAPRLPDPSGLLVRSGLIGRILDADRTRLTVVCASAGYGKTILVAQAVSQGDRLCAWLSLDDRDNDPSRFVAYLIGALRRVHPTVGQSLHQAEPGQNSTWAALESALNDLAMSETAVTLVLDDYHRIHAPVVHQMTTYLIEFMPPQLRVILTSRVDPPLPLARLRARGELLEIRSDDLSFTRKETARYLAFGHQDRLPPGVIARVHARTEGWVVALQLVGLLVRDAPDGRRSEILGGVLGSRRQVAEFLVSEVLLRQPPARRAFLLRTSILSRLSGPLCDAVSGETNGQTVLRELEHDGIPLLALDDQGRWFRYHHLFSEFLAQQLADEVGEEELALLHRRASAWLRDHDQLEEAIDHALAARDWEQAINFLYQVDLVAVSWRHTMTLRRWLEALPTALVSADPVLTHWYGLVLYSTCQPRRARPFLENAEEAFIARGESQSMVARARITRTWVAMVEGRTADALHLASSALELCAGEPAATRSLALITLATATARDGHVIAARSLAAQAIGLHPLVTIASVDLGRMSMLEGRLREAAEQIHYGVSSGNPIEAHRRAYVWLAEIYGAWNDLERAEESLEQVEELASFFDAETYIPSLEVAWARHFLAKGDIERALAELDRGIAGARAVGVEVAVREAEAVRASIWIDQGRIDDATAWSRDAGITADAPPDYARLEEHLVYATLMTVQSRLDEVPPFLDRLRRSAEEGGRVVDVGRILIHTALALQARDQSSAALSTLASAVALLEPSGHIRAFLNPGPALVGPLREVAATGVHLAYVGDILRAAGERPLPVAGSSPGLIDSLSSRELEVLRLVSVGLSNQEISDQLFISVPTVKRHISTILEKLTASSRTHAVSVARSLQLI